MVVFKAHITTGPGGKVLDMFWIYDNRCELPENHRSAPGAAAQACMLSNQVPAAAWRPLVWPRNHSSPLLDAVQQQLCCVRPGGARGWQHSMG